MQGMTRPMSSILVVMRVLLTTPGCHWIIFTLVTILHATMVIPVTIHHGMSAIITSPIIRSDEPITVIAGAILAVAVTTEVIIDAAGMTVTQEMIVTQEMTVL